MLGGVPNDTQFSQQWHHVDASDNDIDSDLAWNITTGGSTALGDAIVVCIVEGFDRTHADLSANAWVNTFEIDGNGIDDDGDGIVDEMVGHGTNVAGIVVQVAPNAQILPVIVSAT